MHASISAFSSAVFYDGLLSTPLFLSQRRSFPSALNDILHIENNPVCVRFLNIGGDNERRGDSSTFGSSRSDSDLCADVYAENTSVCNEAEAYHIISLLKDFMTKLWTSGEPFSGSIGIVTPYTAQVALLKSMMASDLQFRSLIKDSALSIEVNSVDAYQGRERDLIIFSAVRSNRSGKIGFVSDWRRMNVALTRAKSGLIVFGDLDTLKAGDKHWEAFCSWCENVGCVFDIDQLQ